MLEQWCHLVEAVAVLADGELLVVGDGRHDVVPDDHLGHRVVEAPHVRVAQRLVGGEASVGIEHEESTHEFDRLGLGAREEALERVALPVRV